MPRCRQQFKALLTRCEIETPHALVDKCQICLTQIQCLAGTLSLRLNGFEIQAARKDNQQVLKIELQTLKVSTEGKDA